MRYTLNLSFLLPENFFPATKAAEELGFDTVGISESLFFPRDTSSKYPYNATGGREHFEDKPFLDDFSLIPALAVRTERIRFITTVMKLPLRDPVIAAKQVSSVAVLSNDRFTFGVGLSPWPEEYEICGIPWEGRGRRLGEAITVIRGLLTGDYFEFHGQAYDLPPVKLLPPAPSRPVPIVIGGHAEASRRRAARLADGWIAPATGITQEQLADMIGGIQQYRQAYGRDSEPFEIHASLNLTNDADDMAAAIRALEDIGVTDVRVASSRPYSYDPKAQLDGLLEDAEWFGKYFLDA